MSECHFRCKNPHSCRYVVRGPSAEIPEITVCHNCLPRICKDCRAKSIADNHKEEYALRGYGPIYEACDCQNVRRGNSV